MGNDATPLLAFLIIVLVCGSFMSMIVNYLEYSPATDEENNVVVYGAVQSIYNAKTIHIPILDIDITLIPEWLYEYVAGMIIGLSLIPAMILYPMLIIFVAGLIYSVARLVRG